MRLLSLRLSPRTLFWITAFIISLILAANAKSWSKTLDARWLMKLPQDFRLPMKGEISSFMAWLVEDATFGLTRALAWLIEQPYLLVKALLVTGWVRGYGDQAVQILPPLSWIAVIATVFAMGYYARSWRLALFVAAA